jgi:hypothetical protein
MNLFVYFLKLVHIPSSARFGGWSDIGLS